MSAAAQDRAIALLRRIAARESYQAHHGRWEDEAAEIVAALDASTVGVGAIPEGRLRMFLEILSAAGGVQDASDTRWNWINAFCGEHEGRDPDTFNLAEQRGYTTVSHNTDTDEGMVYLTDRGRALLSAAPATQSPAIPATLDRDGLMPCPRCGGNASIVGRGAVSCFRCPEVRRTKAEWNAATPSQPSGSDQGEVTEALRPFLEWGEHLPAFSDDTVVLAGPDHRWQVKITAGDFRRLAALAPKAATAQPGEAIDLGEDQWKRVANAADGSFVRVPVTTFTKCAAAWRWILGIVPQTDHVAQRAEPLQDMFAPPSDISDLAALIDPTTEGEDMRHEG